VLEAKAVGAVFGTERPPEEPLIVGAIKSNIGHGKTASEISGLIKTVLMLEHGVILGNVGFEKPNENMEASYLSTFRTFVRG